VIFLAFVLGIPLLLAIIAMIAGHAHRGEEADLIDWQPARSLETEVKLQDREVDQLRAALLRLRRRRLRSERSRERTSAHRPST
jgi:hypothetical protein